MNKAIKKFCLACCLGNYNEVLKCSSVKCNLYLFREGKSNDKSAKKAIHRYCENSCYGANRHKTEKCAFKDCALYLYRGVTES